MSFSHLRFLTRLQTRFTIGRLHLKTNKQNEMPLLHQKMRASTCMNMYSGGLSRFLINSSIGGIIGATIVVGVCGAGCYGYDYYQEKQKLNQLQKFDKFINYHYVPSKNVPYKIQRTNIEKQIEQHILKIARAPQIVNIICMFTE